jgi:regulator of protease activity HflC (stomatin/prohibitin superfamily)
MFGFKRVVIADYERALLWKNQQLTRVLNPGVYKYFDPLNQVSISKHDITEPELNYVRAEYLAKAKSTLLESYFDIVEMGDTEVGLVYKDNKLSNVLAPGERKLYWRGLTEVTVEKLDISDNYQVPDAVLKRVTRPREAGLLQAFQTALYVLEVPDTAVGMLSINGKFAQMLAPGVYGYWTFNRRIVVDIVDMRLQTIEVTGQEILSKDKVSLRANLSATYLVVDAAKLRAQIAKADEFLYRELQFGLRQVLGTRTLEEILSDKGDLDGAIGTYIKSKVSDYGLKVIGVGVKDIILPGEMKSILNQVVEAEKAAQANVIKRREETSATRSLLNTAKLMDEHPTLMRLKELEALEKVTDKIDRLTVFGGLDGVLKDTVRIAVDGTA